MNTSMGMGGMGAGMNPMMMNPMMGMGMGDGMNPMMGMQGMGMGMPGMGGMGGMSGMGGGMGGGMGMGGMGPGPAGPMGGGPGGPMGGGGDADPRFYKTKMCHKWEQGSCPYGPTCKYAHGPSDLRQPGAGGPRPGTGAGKVMTPNGPPAGPGMGMGMGMGAPMQPRPPAGNNAAGAGGGGGDKSGHWRTRLCEGFMQNGVCRYGDKCTFAHGHQQLRQAGQGGNMQRQGGAGAGQKRALEQGGGESNKRQRSAAEPVEPPAQESFPSKERSLQEVQARFEELIQEANRFARDTGYSVAMFSVGGIYDTEHQDTMEDPSTCIASCAGKAGIEEQDLKVAVLKYATGGVASTLITRQEITKFVAQRGVKAIADMYSSAQGEASA